MLYDNRLDKKNPKAPDFKCKGTNGCKFVVWANQTVEFLAGDLGEKLNHIVPPNYNRDKTAPTKPELTPKDALLCATGIIKSAMEGKISPNDVVEYAEVCKALYKDMKGWV